MAFDEHKNFAYSTVATAPSPATSGTSLVVQAGDGAKFPAVPFNAAVWPAGTQPTAANAEIVRVTGRGTDTLTIVRTQESTSARTIVVGDQIANTQTAKVFTDIEAAINAGGQRPVLLVAASDAPAAAQAGADYLCDGTADNVEIQAALDALPAMGGVVELSQGTFNIAAALAPTKPYTLRGQGAGISPFSSTTPDTGWIGWEPATELVWTGATHGKVVNHVGPLQGFLLDFSIDGSDIADYGIYADRLQAGGINRVGMKRFLAGDGLWLGTTSSTADSDSSFNDIGPLYIESGASNTGACLRLAGNAGITANASHNTFRQIYLRHHATGLALDDCDNNQFLGVYVVRSGGTSYGVDFSADAHQNYLDAVEAGAGGLHASTPTDPTMANFVDGYSRDNSEPAPVLDTGANLIWTEGGQNATNLLTLMASGKKRLQVKADGGIAAANAGMMTKLFDSTLGADAASIDTGAAAIPAGYSSLLIVAYLRTVEAVAVSSVGMTFNNDGGANYDRVITKTANATVTGANTLADTAIRWNVPGASCTAGVFGAARITVPNYDGTVGLKALEFTAGVPDETAANTVSVAAQAQWRSTAAITRVAIANAGANLKAGSRLVVYGLP